MWVTGATNIMGVGVIVALVSLVQLNNGVVLDIALLPVLLVMVHISFVSPPHLFLNFCTPQLGVGL